VVIFYGWNDLWLAKGFSDDQQMAKPETALSALRDQLAKLRTYQLLNQAVGMAQQAAKKKQPEKFRVPVDQYRSNLEDMIRQAQNSGVKVVIATRPAGFGLGPLPDFFVSLGFTRQGEDLQRVSEQYNQAARKVAEGAGAKIADLDLIFREHGVKNFFDKPDKDIIHPNRAGLELIAESVEQAVLSAIGPAEKKEEQ
jgi:lysophospholipase L1-like esterase